MRMKQFEATTLKEALAQAHRELGPGAVLLATHEVPPLSKLGLGRPRVRITASVDEQEERFGKPYLDPSLAGAVQRLDTSLRRPPVATEEVMHQVARQVLRGRDPGGASELQSLLARLRVLPPPWRQGGPRLVLVVGASGVGKTVTAAKIAAHARHHHHCAAGLLSADSVRIAGADQLATYARILDVPFCAVRTPDGVQSALHKLRKCQLIIIDTAGCNPQCAEELNDTLRLQQALRSRAPVESHLVIAATQSEDDQVLCCDAFSRAHAIDALLFTKIDEARRTSNVVRTALHADLPVSLLSASRQVLGRLQPALPEILARLSRDHAA